MICPECCKAEHGQKAKGKVTSEGWNSNGLRRVLSMHGHYYVWCRRYTCSGGEIHDRFTFLGYDNEVLEHLPQYISMQFPAKLTRRSGLDKDTEQLCQSMIQNRCGPEIVARIFKELNTYKYYEKVLTYTRMVYQWNASIDVRASVSSVSLRS